MEFRASEGRGFQPRRSDARNLTCCKCWDAICGGAEAPPFPSVSQQFFSTLLNQTHTSQKGRDVCATSTRQTEMEKPQG